MKTICLGMIVKNETLNIRQTLEAVKSIIDYYVIIDTGSTDDTKAIIKEVLKDIPGDLYDREWINFGWNRSEVAMLTKDKADYSLMLDADFTVVSNGFDKNTLSADKYEMRIQWFQSDFSNHLLFNNKFSWKSVGVVHEYWYAEGIKTVEKLKTLYINHDRHGPARPKGEHDAKLLEQGIKDEPNNARYYFYLANTYRDIGKYKEAIEMFTKRINLSGWDEEVFYSKYQIGYCYELLNEINTAKIAYLKAWEYRPSRSEPLYKLSYLCRLNKEYQQAYLFANRGLEIPYSKDMLFVDSPVYRYALRFERSISAYWIGRYVESIADCDKIDNTPNVPEDVKIQNLKNRKFSEDQLSGGVNA